MTLDRRSAPYYVTAPRGFCIAYKFSDFSPGVGTETGGFRTILNPRRARRDVPHAE